MATPAAPLLERLAARQLVVVTGKGGVGKTTLAALLGRALSRIGRRVLLLETDPRESLHQVLGIEPSGGKVVAAGPRLWAQNLQSEAVMEGLVRDNVDFRLTMSLTPPLCSMLLDPLLQERYIRHISRLIELTEKKSTARNGTARSTISPGSITTAFRKPAPRSATATGATSSAHSANFRRWASWRSSPAARRTGSCR